MERSAIKLLEAVLNYRDTFPTCNYAVRPNDKDFSALLDAGLVEVVHPPRKGIPNSSTYINITAAGRAALDAPS